MPLEDIDARSLTPMMKHWYSVKIKYPNHLCAYRMGDFFEFFYDDAVEVSKLLGITLTKRRIGGDNYPLAGIPHHKGRIVKRGVVRIISPVTIVEPEMLRSNDNNYIASMVKEKKGYGISFADISTGEFFTTEFSAKEKNAEEKLLSVFSQYDPVEVIIPTELKRDERLFIFLTDLTEAIIKTYEDYVFNYDDAYSLITRHFNLSNLKGFGLEETEMAIQAAGGLLAFLKETQRDVIPNVFKIKLIQEKKILHLDYITQRNLELITSLWEKGREATLFSVFNHAHTPMGTRLLKKIILQPLKDIDEINQRLNIVQKFKDDIFLRSELRENLKTIGDLERFVNRVNYKTRTNARELLNIKNSLEIIPHIVNLLKKAKIPEISKFIDRIKNFEEIQSIIEVSIREDAPTTVKEGNLIKEGFNEKVDELRDIINNGKKYILKYEDEQKRRWNLTTGIKVRHNNILGYYIEITFNTLKSISKLPEEYVERSTLKNARRYTTKELKDLENKIVAAEEQINDLEYEIFCTIRDKVIKETENILTTARNIAIIDVLACFAEIAEKYSYCRPKITNDDKIIIKDGRHPVIEQMNLNEKFIPNDCYLDNDTEQILIITGPNMAGKSTYLRQVALICLIAQMGCFIPAKSATIGLIDQIFTRIGASDDLARKLSTFMIEMTETAKILNYTTPRSLIIIDELGRGTSTSDGQSIAMATLEKLHELKCKTLFSTHYHQLTEINLTRVKNYHLDIIENEDGSINFVRKLRPGSTDKSYGIHVAKLAGIPDDVIIRAFEILEQIEERDPFKTAVRENSIGSTPGRHHDKIINGKKKELEQLNQKLKTKKEELVVCEEKLSQITTKVENKNIESQNLKGKIQKNQNKPKKKLVQTSFFKPIVKKEIVGDDEMRELVKTIQEINIESITPVDAMKKLIEFKEKLKRLSS
jgi:DNA mismatch repair protein MutS